MSELDRPSAIISSMTWSIARPEAGQWSTDCWLQSPWRSMARRWISAGESSVIVWARCPQMHDPMWPHAKAEPSRRRAAV